MPEHDDVLHDERGPDPWPEYAATRDRVHAEAAKRRAMRAAADRDATNPPHVVSIVPGPVEYRDGHRSHRRTWQATCACGWAGKVHDSLGWISYVRANADRDHHAREHR